MKTLNKSLAALLLGCGAAAGGLAGTAFFRASGFALAEQRVETTREQLATVNDLSTAFRNVGKVLEPSVVNIQVRKSLKGLRSMPLPDDMFRRFFRQPPQAPNGEQPNGEE